MNPWIQSTRATIPSSADWPKMLGQFDSRSNAQFPIDVSQICLDRFWADEQGGRDVTVGHTRGGKLGHPLLGGRKARAPSLAHTGSVQLGAGPIGPQRSVQFLEHGQVLPDGARRRLFPPLPAL